MSFHQQILRFTIAALLAGAPAARAAARAETLEQMTAEAVGNNPELRVFEQSVLAAKGGVRTARTYANPELKRTRDAVRFNSEFHGLFELSQLFKFPGKRALEIAIAQRNLELTELAREAFRFQVAAKVRRAFYDFVSAQKISQARREQVGSAQNFVESARKRAQAGYASDFEAIKSQAELINANKALRKAEGEMNVARVTLNALMGRSPAGALEISGDLDNVAPRGSRTDFVALALARNPGIRTQLRQVEISGLSLRSTRFGRRPDIAVGPSVKYTDTEQIFGLQATLALPFWDQKKGEIETASANQRRSLAELEKTRAEVVAEVTKAATKLELVKQQLSLYSPALLNRLQAFMAQAEQGYAQNNTTTCRNAIRKKSLPFR